MILGLSTAAFTLLHVIVSLVGIGTGLIVLLGMFTSRRLEAWTALFLTSTVLTNVTGFFFNSTQIGAPHIVGAISLIVLAVTIPALYIYQLRGAWRAIYVSTAVLALYLNVFVGMVQLFLKIAFFNALAPTQTEPAFFIAQGTVLVLFVLAGSIAVRRFHPEPSAAELRLA
jgi:hypothetical protein